MENNVPNRFEHSLLHSHQFQDLQIKHGTAGQPQELSNIRSANFRWRKCPTDKNPLARMKLYCSLVKQYLFQQFFVILDEYNTESFIYKTSLNHELQNFELYLICELSTGAMSSAIIRKCWKSSDISDKMNIRLWSFINWCYWQALSHNTLIFVGLNLSREPKTVGFPQFQFDKLVQF